MAIALPRPGDLRDPLLERDYVRLCSRPTSFRNRALAALATGVVVLLVYASSRGRSSQDQVGRLLHAIFTWAACILVFSTALGEASVALASERAANTLPVLLTVPRSHARLATGFLLSRYLAALTGLLAILPVEGFSLLLGGVSGADLLRALLLVATFGGVGAAAGVLGGHGARDHRRALGRGSLVAFAWLGLVALLFVGVAGIFKIRTMGHSDAAEAFLGVAGAVFAASPLHALWYMTMRSWGAPALRLTPDEALAIPAAVALLGMLLSVRVAARRLRDEEEKASRVFPAAAGPLALLRRVFGRRSAPAAEAGAPPAPLPWKPRVWLWALLWKESRPPRSPWVRWGLRAIFLGYGVFLGWMLFSADLRQNVQSPGETTSFYDFWVGIPVMAVVLGSLASSATFLGEERERSTLDLLRAAPFGPREYILARPLAVAIRLWPLAALTAAFAGVGVFRGQVHVLAPAAWVAGGLLCGPFLALASFWRGMRAPTARSASKRVGAALGFLIVGWPFLVGFLSSILRWRDDTVLPLMGLNPVAPLGGPYTLFATYLDGRADHEALGFGFSATAAGICYLFAALLLWKLLPRALDRALHAAEEGG